MKLTPWFSPDVNPVRAGVYEVKQDDTSAWYRRWDGEDWYVGGPTPGWASNAVIALDNGHRAPWRGLAEEPK